MYFNADLNLCAKVKVAKPNRVGISKVRFIVEAVTDLLADISKGNKIHFTYERDQDDSGKYKSKVAFMQYSFTSGKKSDKRFVAPGDKLSEYMNDKVFEAIYIYLQLKCEKCGYQINNDFTRTCGTAILCEPKASYKEGMSVAELISSPQYYITAEEYSGLNDDILTEYLNKTRWKNKDAIAQTSVFDVPVTSLF